MFLTFSNAALLIGVAGAVVPLVLHLLSRTRYRAVDWGAMIFLEGTEARQQYNARLNQVLLLGLRMAVVGLAAVALAQPVLKHWSFEASAAAQAVREAERGRLLCLAGAVLFGLGTALLVPLAWSSIKRLGWSLRHAPILMMALLAGLATVASGRRAIQWHVRLAELQLRQLPQTSGPAAAATAPRADVAILLDCSTSMEFEENGHTRFSIAQGAAKQVLAGLHRGDRVLLVLLGVRQSEAQAQPTTDLQSVADRIDAAHVGHDPADVAHGLLTALEVLDNGGVAARDFYVVCDRQKSLWHGLNSTFQSRWAAALRKSGVTGRIFVVLAGSTDADNVAVEDVELAEAPAILGQPANVTVTLHNYGSSARPALPLAVLVDRHAEFQTTVSVPAEAVTHVSVPLRAGAFAASGAHVISAEIKTAGYRDDDHFDAVIDMIDPVRVLVISGDDWGADSSKFRNESDFIRLALAPFRTSGREGADPCKVEVTAADRWADLDLQPYQVVVLANIERFSDAPSRAIEQYVYGGGGVLIAPGSLSRIENYNEQLWRDGGGILPAELEEPTPADGTEATAIVGYDSSSPIFQFLRQRPDLMLFPTIGRYFPTTPRSSESRALAWYTSGAPFLLESAGGRGRVLLMTTSLDADWSTLPLSSFYLPFVQSAVRYLAGGTLPSHNLVAGEPIRVTLDEPVSDPATVDPPEGEARQVEAVQSGQTTEFRFTDTYDTGVYRVRVKEPAGERTFLFAVHGSQEASDLTQLTDQEWTRVENEFRLRRIDPADRPIAAAVSADREGYDLAAWALAAALIAAVLEVALARRWAREN